MSKTFALSALLVIALSTGADAQDARTVIDTAARAMGATGLDSITYSGTAAVANFGQSRHHLVWTRLDDDQELHAHHRLRAAGVARHRRGRSAGGAGRPGARGVRGVHHSADTAWARQLEIWVTPWGFLRGAAASAATVKSQRIDGTAYQVVTWMPAQKAPSGQQYRLVGYINPQNLVERVETWSEHPVLGDLHVETRYSDYRDAGGVKVPGRIAQRRIGMETFVAVIGSARANPPDLAALMTPSQPVERRAAAAIAAASENVAAGVYRITAGYVALAVEMRDYAGGARRRRRRGRGPGHRRGGAATDSGKPIRYVVNTHPHFDHAAVLPPFAAEGITILTDDPNRYFLEQALGSPRTLVGDALAKSRRRPKVESVIDTMVLKDSTRSIELRHLVKFDHSDGMLVVYLPKEKILFTADVDAAAPSLRALALEVERHIIGGEAK